MYFCQQKLKTLYRLSSGGGSGESPAEGEGEGGESLWAVKAKLTGVQTRV